MLSKYQKYVVYGFINTKSLVKNVYKISKINRVALTLIGDSDKGLATVAILLYI